MADPDSSRDQIFLMPEMQRGVDSHGSAEMQPLLFIAEA
jgi:hypothetical protein